MNPNSSRAILRATQVSQLRNGWSFSTMQLLQLVRGLRDAGVGTNRILVATRSTTYRDGAYELVPNLNRHAAFGINSVRRRRKWKRCALRNVRRRSRCPAVSHHEVRLHPPDVNSHVVRSVIAEESFEHVGMVDNGHRHLVPVRTALR